MLNTIKPWFNFEIIELKKLNGYDKVNYLLKTETDNYIFKTYVFSQDMLALIAAENSVLQTLKKDQSSHQLLQNLIKAHFSSICSSFYNYLSSIFNNFELQIKTI
ncbi:hypothetical protein [Psychroserpens burtonensis]|uniref:hypothetical protein n=1 Tax=Psychroserpens burtonensis TaxID=49278 RepID=UPI0003FD9247|nr:hypothetical protein [Psychroserpens burtonensis]